MSDWQLEIVRTAASVTIALVSAYLGYRFASKVQRDTQQYERETAQVERNERRSALRFMLREENEMNTNFIADWWNRPAERNYADVIREPLPSLSFSIWNGQGPNLLAALSSVEVRRCWNLYRDLHEFQAIVTHLAGIRAADLAVIQQAGGARQLSASHSDQFPSQARDAWPRLKELADRIIDFQPLETG